MFFFYFNVSHYYQVECPVLADSFWDGSDALEGGPTGMQLSTSSLHAAVSNIHANSRPVWGNTVKGPDGIWGLPVQGRT